MSTFMLLITTRTIVTPTPRMLISSLVQYNVRVITFEQRPLELGVLAQQSNEGGKGKGDRSSELITIAHPPLPLPPTPFPLVEYTLIQSLDGGLHQCVNSFRRS